MEGNHCLFDSFHSIFSSLLILLIGQQLYRYRVNQRLKREALKDPTKGALTQEELNELHLGPEFLVSRRYAQVMADLFVCYMFCTGMPILTIVGTVNFYVAYWVDKFLFLRFYRRLVQFSIVLVFLLLMFL